MGLQQLKHAGRSDEQIRPKCADGRMRGDSLRSIGVGNGNDEPAEQSEVVFGVGGDRGIVDRTAVGSLGNLAAEVEQKDAGHPSSAGAGRSYCGLEVAPAPDAATPSPHYARKMLRDRDRQLAREEQVNEFAVIRR